VVDPDPIRASARRILIGRPAWRLWKMPVQSAKAAAIALGVNAPA
jgi:hypothetical protein